MKFLNKIIQELILKHCEITSKQKHTIKTREAMESILFSPQPKQFSSNPQQRQWQLTSPLGALLRMPTKQLSQDQQLLEKLWQGNPHVQLIIPLPDTDSRDRAYVLPQDLYCNNNLWLSQNPTTHLGTPFRDQFPTSQLHFGTQQESKTTRIIT